MLGLPAASADGPDALLCDADLARAIDRGEMTLVYQPLVSVEDERTIGAEALIRWQHPRHGLLEPSQFIPLAEESGLIGELDEWVLERACRQSESWRTAGLGRLTMAVNMSAQEFGDAGLVGRVAETLRATGADPRRLVVEITETAPMNFDASAAVLLALRDMGITLALDDFGTGHSSFAYLARLPVGMLKIDRSFVDGLGREAYATSIVAALVAMSRALGLTTVAEGVEREEQLVTLRALGCDLAQGYRWVRPLPPGAFARRVFAEHVTAGSDGSARGLRVAAPTPAVLV
jgi:EAL domain-containing protein (putative c-di-GMP-specific phosphodiesterase class I)